MRVTSDFFVSALLRRVFSSGGFGAIVRRGATEAGAVYFVSRNRFGEMRLIGPASQSSYGDERPDDRFFVEMTQSDEAAVNARLEKEQRFDPDIWIVEIEPGSVSLEDLLTIRA